MTDRQARSSLGAAVDKIASFSRRAEQSKDSMLATGTQVFHTANPPGTLFLSSKAEGYVSRDKIEMAGVDVRAPVRLVAAGYGQCETMSCWKITEHPFVIICGVLGSRPALVKI